MKHVVLIGFMGSGKSTVGYRLSYLLKKCLLDTDRMIEEREEMNISRIFAEKGEEYFRQLETECLKVLTKELGSRVVSLGGGTPIRRENHDLIKKLGTVIYLKAAPETIYERVKRDKNRPLLQCDDPKAKIRQLLEERNPIYEEVADIVISVDGKEMPQVLNEIMEVLQHENSCD